MILSMFKKAEFVLGFVLVVSGWMIVPTDKHSLVILSLLFCITGGVCLIHAIIKDVVGRD